MNGLSMEQIVFIVIGIVIGMCLKGSQRREGMCACHGGKPH